MFQFDTQDLQLLPKAKTASHAEVMAMIEHRALRGRGIQYNDVHLLASAVLTQCPLWTLDRRLRDAAAECRVEWPRSD